MLKITPGVNPSSLDVSRDTVRGELASPPRENLGSDHPGPEVLVWCVRCPSRAEHTLGSTCILLIKPVPRPHPQPCRPPAHAGPPQSGWCTPRTKPRLLTSDGAFPLSPQLPPPHVHCAWLFLPFHLAIIKGQEQREPVHPSPRVSADIMHNYSVTAGKWMPVWSRTSFRCHQSCMYSACACVYAAATTVSVKNPSYPSGLSGLSPTVPNPWQPRVSFPSS